MFAAINNEAFQVSVIETIANRRWNLDNLLAVIDKLPNKGSYISLLLKINYYDGTDNFIKRVIKYGSRFDDLFTIIIETLVNQLNIEVQSMILISLQLETNYRNRVMNQLLPILKDHGWLDFKVIIKFLFEEASHLLPLFITYLFNLRIFTFNTAQELLSIPRSIYGDNWVQLKNIFELIFQTLVNFALSSNELENLMKQIANWLKNSNLVWINPPLDECPSYISDIANIDAMKVPLPIWLVSSSLLQINQIVHQNLGNSILILNEFVKAIYKLDSAAEDVFLWLSRVPGMAVLLLPSLF